MYHYPERARHPGTSMPMFGRLEGQSEQATRRDDDQAESDVAPGANEDDDGEDLEDEETDGQHGQRKRQRGKTKKSNPLISSSEKCRVCQEPAAKHIHYGSVTCFSCRAFFRRSIQDKTARVYKCRKSNNCDVTKKLRKSCQKCRFDKCMASGMKPSWVLSSEEKERRFRKNKEKKKREEAMRLKSSQEPNNGAGGSSQNITSPPARRESPDPLEGTSRQYNSSIYYQTPILSQRLYRNQVSSSHLANFQSYRQPLAPCWLMPVNPVTRQYFNPNRYQYPISGVNQQYASPNWHTPTVQATTSQYSVEAGPSTSAQENRTGDDTSSNSSGEDIEPIVLEPIVEISEDELFRIRCLSEEHDRSYKSVAFGEELIKEMVMCSVFGVPLSTTAALTGYRLMVQRVTKVAQTTDIFLDLPFKVQSKLLKQNADLLVSLRGAVFFEDKKKGLDQILYSMGVEDIDIGKKLIISAMKSVGNLGRIDYKCFNSLQKIDSGNESETRYNRLLSRVGSTMSKKHEFVRLMTYVILFAPDLCDLNSQERKEVESIQYMYINMLKRFVFSQFRRDVAVSIFSNLLSTIADLNELTIIKRQRMLAAPAQQPSSSS